LPKRNAVARATVRVLAQTRGLVSGFGQDLNLANATHYELLPGFRAERLELVGNTVLGGASLALIGLVEKQGEAAGQG